MISNTINDIRSIQTTSTVKPEAVQAGQPDETTQVQQNSSGKTANSPQAVLVALENIITTELSELSQTVANRTALIKSLPPEIRELVQQLVSQNQAAQTTLQEGLVALLKSSKTGAEKLAMLADIMEQAAGLTNGEGQGPDAKQSEMVQRQGNLSNNSQNLPTKLVMPTGDPIILLTDELDELTQTIANRTVKSLPPENRGPVQQLLSQDQATQTSLPAGVVALLKSSTTRAEKTAILADSIEGQGEASSSAATGKQQLQTELTAALQGKNPGDLQAMAKVLRQLAARSNVPGNNQQDMRAAIQQPDGLVSQLSEKKAELAPTNKAPNQGPEGKQPEMPQRQENSPNNSQNLPTKPAALAGDSVKSQETAQLLKALTTQPELAESLPPEIRKIVLAILQQEESGQEQVVQTTLPEAEEGQGPSAKQSPIPQRQENSLNNSQNLPTKPAMSAGDSVKPQELAQLLKAFTTQSELAQSLPPEIRKIVLTLLQQEESSQEQAAQITLPKAKEGQEPEAKQSPMPQRQDNSPSNLQNLPTRPAMPAGDLVKSQELAQLLKAFTTQPELAQSLPPEIRKLVLTLLQQEEPASPTAQTTQMPASAQTTQNQKLPAQQTPSPISQSSPPTLTAQASSPQTGQLMQTLSAAVAELVTALKKSQQSPIEKIIVFANILEQAAELLTPKHPQGAQSFGLSQQAIVELANLWQGESPEEVKAAIKVVRELAETMSKPSGVTAERQDAQRVLTIAVPLYFGDGQTVYPAYIHVYYQEEEDKKNPGRKVTETWLRICLETENIGMVDAAFRLYDGNNLDVKVRFTDAEAASGFADSMEEVREQLGQLPLTLGEFLVR
ncbi:hypothetical protein [Sporomusa sp. KB1]|jgi:tellurite resistance protein|uniref:hypothetical protein n=1 Tax=Sporomusa sp. KB1 TaxID=943346 RepID=UPI00119D55DE|nr:hypothetical protein [Sporomusa sp. KB1]TWH45393.1 hypothetical protein Salpa_1303 [Sporomusa sp. KB1]